jgi:hypothetical protein
MIRINEPKRLRQHWTEIMNHIYTCTLVEFVVGVVMEGNCQKKNLKKKTCMVTMSMQFWDNHHFAIVSIIAAHLR